MFQIRIGGSKVPYYGSLQCPGCRGKRIKKVEMIGHFISRWKCKDCNLTFRYDQTPQGIPYKSKKEPKGYDPYGSFKRGIKKPW